jgi:ribosomal protein S18 acetylase RimI-like enzyme
MPRIRDFRPQDMEKIMEFTRRVMLENFPGCEFNGDVIRKSMERHLRVAPDAIKVLEVGGESAGYVWMKVVKSAAGVFGRLEQLFIEERYRKQGLGKRLVSVAEEYFRRKGLKKVKLTVTKENNSALSLYSSMGYEARRLVMEKDL